MGALTGPDSAWKCLDSAWKCPSERCGWEGEGRRKRGANQFLGIVAAGKMGRLAGGAFQLVGWCSFHAGFGLRAGQLQAVTRDLSPSLLGRFWC